MSHDANPGTLQYLRGTDSNSLLRLYDRACQAVNRSSSQQERVRADKAIQRIARELEKRNVRF
jgi:hypothetical protein